ncbi:hypothetical protein [Amycolatopsis silviterrae]|uniref:WXG100 family type VII secretion target n=1 Tax=Amycolatopsis silviterrae TaxID=1656914 RepID=A0ABW5HIH6_9PSEU
MPPTAEQLINPLEKAFDTVRRVIKQIIDKFNAAVDHINDWSFAFGPLMETIKIGMDNIKEGLDKVYKLIEYALRHQAPIISLVYQAFRWIDSVQHPLNGVYSQTNPGSTQAPSYHNEELAKWQGDAKTVYDGKVTEQVNAIDAMGTKADSISKWLMDIAQANVRYMSDLAGIADDFLGKIAEAAIDAATVVGIPFAVGNLSSIIGGLVTNGLNLLVEVANRFMETLSRIRDLNSWMNDKALPASRWPQAVHPAGA